MADTIQMDIVRKINKLFTSDEYDHHEDFIKALRAAVDEHTVRECLKAQVKTLNGLFDDLNDDTLTELYARIQAEITRLEAELKEL